MDQTAEHAKNRVQLTNLNKFAYGLSDFGNNICFVVVTNYLMFYYTDVASLGLAAVGALFLIVRVLDAFVGIAFGTLIDNTHSKYGKVRPWFLWLAIPYGLATIALFSIGYLPFEHRILAAYITYILFNIFYAGINTAITSLLPSLSTNVDDRASANAFRNVLGQVGNFASSLLALPLISLFGHGINQKGFTEVMVLFGFVLMFSELFTFTFVKENTYKTKKASVSLKDGLKALLPNRPWWAIAITNLVIFIGVVTKQQAVVYFFKYVLHNANGSAIMNGVGAIGMIIGMALIPKLIKLQKAMRTVAIEGLIVAIVGQIILYVSFVTRSETIAYIGNLIGSFGLGGSQSLVFLMIAETVDYGQWKFGVRAQGLLVAMASVGTTIGAGLAGALSSKVLASYGFVANANQNARSLMGINMLLVIVPAIVFAICMITLSFYNVDKYESTMHTALAKE